MNHHFASMTATESIPQEISAHLPAKALVVEDHQGLGMLLRCVLGNHGIEAEIAPNGAEAIVRLKDAAADYGLVLSDVELPGASGWTILEWVRARYPGLPMVLISGVHDGNFVREAHRRGAVGAFRKPFNFGEIQHMLSELFPSV